MSKLMTIFTFSMIAFGVHIDNQAFAGAGTEGVRVISGSEAIKIIKNKKNHLSSTGNSNHGRLCKVNIFANQVSAVINVTESWASNIVAQLSISAAEKLQYQKLVDPEEGTVEVFAISKDQFIVLTTLNSPSISKVTIGNIGKEVTCRVPYKIGF